MGQAPHCALPQSTNGSLPLRTPSLQRGGWQQRAIPCPQPRLSQTPLSQSSSARQALPASQGSQRPPQSAALSFWFNRPSSQFGAAQTEARHTPVAQSALARQAVPTGQGGQLPPQSAALSLPLRTPSAHETCVQSPVDSGQNRPVSQSSPAVQAPPSGQRA